MSSSLPSISRQVVAKACRAAYSRAKSTSRQIIGKSADACSAFIPQGVARQRFRELTWVHIQQTALRPPSVDRLAQLEGANRGERCFIIGTSASLDVDTLGEIREGYVFLVNRAYLFSSKFFKPPDAIAVSNPHALLEYGHEIANSPIRTCFISAHIPTPFPRCTESTIYFSQFEVPKIKDGFFQTNCTAPLYHGNTVILTPLQLAVWMGFSEIVLLGIDFSFRRAEPHCYASSKTELRRSQTVSLANARTMQKSLEFAANFVKNRTRSRLLTAGPVEVFPYIQNTPLRQIL